MTKLYDLEPGTEIYVINGDYSGCIIEENGQKYFLVFTPLEATKHILTKDMNYGTNYDIVEDRHSPRYYKEWLTFNNYIPKNDSFYCSSYKKEFDNYEVYLNIVKEEKIELKYWSHDLQVFITSEPFKAEEILAEESKFISVIDTLEKLHTQNLDENLER